MPVSYIPSAEQLVDRQKTTAKKRRRNQNTEIDELAKLLPIKPLPVSATPFSGEGAEPGSDSEPSTSVCLAKANQPVDKISVLRITSTFLKFQEFLSNGYFSFAESPAKRPNNANLPSDLLAEAMDGFLIALDKDGTILYASESITSYIGLTQHDVIGQGLDDIAHPDDKELIRDNLTPKANLPPGITNKSRDTQPRQFYIRFKSTMSPGRVQLSRFNSYTMIQVTGNLKVRNPDSGEPGTNPGERKEAIGFVGECRLIESTSSILEISIPQSYFTTTISMEMKIVSVESQMKELIGFSADEFVGTRLRDYFHPADYTKLIPCEVMLMHTGHAVSPVFRFMSASGGWVWMQMEGILRYKPGTKERQFWEIKVKMVSQEEGHIALIEQNELYAPNPDPEQDLLNPHKDRTFLAKLKNASPLCRNSQGPEPILNSLRKANLSGSLIDSVLHGREMGMSELPGNIKRVLLPNQADDFKEKLRKKLDAGTWGKTDLHFDGFEHVVKPSPPPFEQILSPPPNNSRGTSPTPTITSTLSSTMTSDPSLSGRAQPGIYGNRTHSENDPAPVAAASFQPFCNQQVSYYSGCCLQGGVPSPVSAHNSPQAPPTTQDGSPAHSSMYYGHDVRSPPGSGVPSPAASSILGVASMDSPAPSFVSSAHSAQMGMRGGPMMPAPNGPYAQFSQQAPGNAISTMFGNVPTNSAPNFTAGQFQGPQHGVTPVVPGINVSSDDVSGILSDFHDPGNIHDPGNMAATPQQAHSHSQNWNGEDDSFLAGLSEMNSDANKIRFYGDSHSSNRDVIAGGGGIPHHPSYSHQYHGDVTVSAAAANEGVEGVAAPQGGRYVGGMVEGANSSMDTVDQFLSQLINS